MSIIGVGTDLESVDRFEEPGCTGALIQRVFTDGEIEYCRSQAKPSRHFAARFAAKEAAVKALHSVLPTLVITQIEVFKEVGSPAPQLRLISGATLPAGINLFASVSHTDKQATAFVIAERQE